jgi:methionyl-tRNA formyltransferase
VAIPLLDWLAGEGSAIAKLVGVVTGPDRPSGRGQEVNPNSVKAWTGGRGLAVLQPEKLDADALASLRALGPDVVLVVAYGHILRDPFITLPRLGTLNLHASLLPKYRGASPIQTAVASGDATSGMALMRIVRELDAGPVAGVETVEIGPDDTALEVEARLAGAAVPLVERLLPELARGTLVFKEQKASEATFCRRLSKADGVLDFEAPASVLAARINGLNPWPSVSVDLAGLRVKFGQAEAIEPTESSPVPGTVIGWDDRGLRISTRQGVLRVRRIQRPGGRMLPTEEFLRGFQVSPGTTIASLPMPPLVSPSPFPR